jgi:hypothetical protein
VLSFEGLRLLLNLDVLYGGIGDQEKVNCIGQKILHFLKLSIFYIFGHQKHGSGKGSESGSGTGSESGSGTGSALT